MSIASCESLEVTDMDPSPGWGDGFGEQNNGPKAHGSHLSLAAQTLLAALLIATIALMPPRRGPMIVVPISSSPIKPWLDARQGVTVLGLGKIAGSIIVDADRDTLLPAALANHAILLPALPALCALRPGQIPAYHS